MLWYNENNYIPRIERIVIYAIVDKKTIHCIFETVLDNIGMLHNNTLR